MPIQIYAREEKPPGRISHPRTTTVPTTILTLQRFIPWVNFQARVISKPDNHARVLGCHTQIESGTVFCSPRNLRAAPRKAAGRNLGAGQTDSWKPEALEAPGRRNSSAVPVARSHSVLNHAYKPAPGWRHSSAKGPYLCQSSLGLSAAGTEAEVMGNRV